MPDSIPLHNHLPRAPGEHSILPRVAPSLSPSACVSSTCELRAHSICGGRLGVPRQLRLYLVLGTAQASWLADQRQGRWEAYR